jgi:uncharacterized protein (TIGR00661 family)
LSLKKRILVAPLDWGLGHITRCIPIIEKLLKNDHTVFTCGNKESEQLFKEHFPKIKHIIISGYNVKYSRRNSQALSMALQTPKFIFKIKNEKKIAEDLASKLNLDIIISDNRFGFRSSKTTNIIISHQIHIQGPWFLKPILYKINSSYINQFDNCWIPDYNDTNSLAGDLSKNPKLNNYSFIGPLSRFKKSKNIIPYKYKYLAILSGPEPQRSIFEKIVLKAFSKLNEPCAIIGGNPLGKQYSKNNIEYFCHLKTEDFLNTVNVSEFLICRSGYSNIMDLSVLNKKALLVPTPGQTEQEYLAKYHTNKSSVKWINQQEFKINGDSDFGQTITSKINYLLDKEFTKVGL